MTRIASFVTMADPIPMRFEVDVPSDGRIEFCVPRLAGSHVTVYVTEHPADKFDDLLAAAASSTDFWDNPYDDEDWNEA
jgi:hypothetical protein